MKSVKYFIFGFIVCFIVIFLIGIIFTKIDNKVYIKTIDKYDNTVTSLSSKLDGINNSTCKKSIKELLERSKSTYFMNNVSIKKYVDNYYANNTDFYKMYLDTLDSCDMDQENSKEITKLVIASKSFPESIKAKLNSSYEIKFIDYMNYKNVHQLSDNIGSYSNKELELMVIDRLISNNTKSVKKSK